MIFYRRNTPMAYEDSIIAGIDIIPFCKVMKKKGVILDATLCVSEEKDPWVFALLKRVHKQGVKISTGTDQIVDSNRAYPRLIDELDYFLNKCGFTPAQALYSATQISAEVIGQEKNRGSIKVGKRADLLILKDNPLLDVNSLKNIHMVTLYSSRKRNCVSKYLRYGYGCQGNWQYQGMMKSEKCLDVW